LPILLAVMLGLFGCQSTLVFCDSAHGCGPEVNPLINCTTNQQCIDAFAPTSYECRKSDHICVSFMSEDCTTIMQKPEDIASADAIVLGSSLPTAASDACVQNALQLAIEEWGNVAVGIPAATGQPPRPVVVVGCNESPDPMRAAHHLVDDLQVPAIF